MSTDETLALAVMALDRRVARLEAIEAPAYNIACRAYNTADRTIATATTTVVPLDAERYDTANLHSTSTNTSRMTVPVAGRYLMIGNVRWAANATGVRAAQIWVNGITLVAANTVTPTAGGVSDNIVATVYPLAVNDYAELFVFQTSGGNLTLVSSHAIDASFRFSPEFMVHLLP